MKIFSHVIVSTENKQIANIAKKYGAEVPFLNLNQRDYYMQKI